MQKTGVIKVWVSSVLNREKYLWGTIDLSKKRLLWSDSAVKYLLMVNFSLINFAYQQTVKRHYESYTIPLLYMNRGRFKRQI